MKKFAVSIEIFQFNDIHVLGSGYIEDKIIEQRYLSQEPRDVKTGSARKPSGNHLYINF